MQYNWSVAIRYWMGVAQREHVRRCVRVGVAQVGPGLRRALEELGEADGLVYYSPRTAPAPDGDRLSAFTAIGRIAVGPAYQEFPGAERPWRRRTEYETDVVEAPIRPLLPVLDFSREHRDWGFRLRAGLFEISRRDFEVIRRQMRRPSADDR
ncbi:EVE domain-containing protein [Cryobacterium tepidiphilum]|uniref:EVE domain-containing protein n=1 Tax=Cryobacterium tepidiphilum TaxID=2486026 RepID=A0A3M8LPM2_9MICO|nr:EVE domain-containing protein [Cryobacterium tepidiphilum]RNE67423.1 EVE domain-containing protein [Cryobacterium tepidiphilum]